MSRSRRLAAITAKKDAPQKRKEIFGWRCSRAEARRKSSRASFQTIEEMIESNIKARESGWRSYCLEHTSKDLKYLSLWMWTVMVYFLGVNSPGP